ncbi:arsinothricin resistance N-acetyltransferase ArsN1 family B [Acuticoccus sp. I52.16.1]|uniref:arsinothricin resistance N-acetyltransferase ArsN1 family B n=1 Tax=Acuticoccus sp. I52.16.1 TaxID=2928472 RepID=UPI001FD20FF0|nr:arsinothricin resistance N-acetyltransferase ArsN1 family B [Acuticoccus sp. I52.16.1]UOM32893.1 N-acetyltransferase family protein [Acuticoccus sp. I52.16.1]
MRAAASWTIRLATLADAPAIAAIYAPVVETTAISFEEVVPDAEEIARRIAATLGPWPYLVAERDGAVAGYAYASAYRPRAAYRWSVEVTVYVDAAVRGGGAGTALYGRLLPLLIAQGYRAAFAGITLPNAGSVALHERLGFRHTGTDPAAGFKLGRWWDVGRWARPLRELGAAPPPATPLGDLDPTLLADILAGRAAA